ncbi:MAG: c-type cytochrome [Betaproteobacteria bacterium]|nr:MAG: c-type cytochrome [Betaproteobacteria bacterium]
MQGRGWRGIAAGLFAGAVVFLSVASASAANRWGADYFPNVPLTTQEGATVHLYDDLLKGKSVAINVMYTSCKDECPLETARLAQVQRLLGERMGKDIFFYSITIDPKRDKPEVLKAYADKYGVGPGWLFLTGREEAIKLATKKLGLSRVRDSASKDGHTASLMVGNEPAGLWMRNSAVDNPQFLATTIGNFLGWKDTTPKKSYAEARPLVLDKGEYFFQSQCSVCHSIGQGNKMGPDLAGVTARRDRAWLTRYITAPDKMLAEGDPIATALFEKYQYARMPNLRLSSDEVAAVLSYVEGRGAAPREPVRRDSVTTR